MRDGGRLAAAMDVLTEIETRHRPVRLAMKAWGEGARYAGSKDRAFISGLRKKGVTVEREERRDGAKAYRIVKAAQGAGEE